MIDFKFIQELEGKRILTAYVPKDKYGQVLGQSGITISSGVDLGQMEPDDLRKLFGTFITPFGKQLLDKLIPYCGWKGLKAVGKLETSPLVLNDTESRILDNLMYEREVKDLESAWYKLSGKSFRELPDRVQTVLFSLQWNFGSILKLPETSKRFVESFKSGNWMSAYTALKNFSSKQKELDERRQKEAEYLKPLLDINNS